MTESFNYAGTAYTEPPTYSGGAGRAWQLRLRAPGAREVRDHDATVGGYIVHAPGGHPLWSFWIVSVIHLRPIDGVRAPVISRPGATHELLIMSLDPRQPLPTLDVTDGWRVAWLSPIDIVEQFTAADDAVAAEILDLSVRAIVDGRLSPDQDFRATWRVTLRETAAHFATGRHEVRRS
jgi:hypothetical protein